ncbi:MAG: hypothetical protein QM681_23670 [Novosphingobium sp.]
MKEYIYISMPIYAILGYFASNAVPRKVNSEGTPKWLPSRTEATLNGLTDRPAATSNRYAGHSDASMPPFMS